MFYTKSQSNVTVNNLALYDSNTQARSILAFTEHKLFILNGLIVSNNTRKPYKNLDLCYFSFS